MAHRSVGIGTSLTLGPGLGTSTLPFSVQSDTIRIVAVDAACHVAVGGSPKATDGSYYVAKNTAATIGLTKASNRVVGITTGTTSQILFAEGTYCPFGEGDYIAIEGTGVTGFTTNFEHSRVITVNTTASSPNTGYFQSLMTVDVNSTKLTEADVNFADVTAIMANKAFVLGKGSGCAYIQQVQISGDA